MTDRGEPPGSDRAPIRLPVLALLLAMLCGCSSTPKRPNIVFLMLDEWGYYEMSALGHPLLQTPNIDRFAAEGMRFTQALAGAPVCGPTRVSLMLGQHTGHTSMRTNGGYTPIRADDVTFVQLLQDAGYATAGFGKWGCGGRGTSGVPEKHGFDTFFGYYDQRHAHTYYPSYLIRNSQEVPLPGNTNDFYRGETWSHQVIVDEAMSWLDRHHREPFFLYLPWTPPHGLWAIPEDEAAWKEYANEPWTAGQRRKTDSRVYAAMLKLVDRQIGRLLDKLETYGIDEDTIVVLCGDNGGQDYFRQGGRYPRGFFAPNVDPRTHAQFRGQKGQLYEGGLRIPMMVRWPGHIQAGVVSDHLWYFPDVMPTLAQLAGVDSPDSTDGISIVPTLLQRGEQPRHPWLYWEYGKQTAVRMDHWKAVRTQRDGAWALYDLSVDLGEQHDVAEARPEIVERVEAIANEAHEPARPGKVLDRALAEKDFRAVYGK